MNERIWGTLEDVCGHLNNWFAEPEDIHAGTFTVKDGGLSLPYLADVQYYRIAGSVFNDGIHRYGMQELVSETFTGTVWAMKVPPAVEALAEEIAAWQEKYGEAASGPYQSESFGGYTYTKASGDGSADWQSVFRKRLNRWRKI